MNLSRISSAVSKALVGAEHLAPEVRAATRKLVTESGHINQEALGSRKLLGDFLLGKKGTLEALKGRYAQGGIIGPGGLIRGEFALDPRYKQLVKSLAESDSKFIVNPYTGKQISRPRAVSKAITAGISESLNPLLLLGFPAMEISEALNTPDSDSHGGYSGIGGALGSGLGFTIGGPLGILGGLASSHLGDSAGRYLGSLIDPKPLGSGDISQELLDSLPTPINSRR